MSHSPENRPESEPEIRLESQPTQVDSVIQFTDESEDWSGYIAFITGHMFDHSNRKTPRFPEKNYQQVRDALRKALDSANLNQPIQKIVCSGTAGADLIAAEWALDNGLSVVLYLPYDEQAFVEGAVAYSGDLGTSMREIFERVKADSESHVYIPSLANGNEATLEAVKAASAATGDNYRHYADLNRHMVNKLKPKDLVIAVWDGKGGDSPGGTEHAVRTAQDRGASVLILNQGIENIAESYPDFDENK